MKNQKNYNFQKSIAAKREVRHNTPLRRARTCYGHLAGVVGVNLFNKLIEKNWIRKSLKSPNNVRIEYQSTDNGITHFQQNSVIFNEKAKMIGNACPDWTEKGFHLGGLLGRTIVNIFVSKSYISLNLDRTVNIIQPFEEWFSSTLNQNV